MIAKPISLIFIIFMNIQSFFGQSNSHSMHVPHFYVYLKEDKKPFKMEIGNYKSTKSKLKYQDEYATIDQLEEHINLPEKDHQRWLIYIHGLWANQKVFEESTGKILQEEIFNKLEDYDAIISLKWTSTIDYEKNLIITEQKGEEFAKVINQLTKGKNIELNFLLHSMGNRVFKTLGSHLEGEDVKVNNILMIAADIENDVFVNDLKDIPSTCSKIYSFYNIDDRTLTVANKLKSFKRLGLYGPCEESRKLANVIPISTTGLKDNEGISAQFTLHRYYYASPSVRKLILDILSGKEEGTLFDKIIKL